MAATIAHIAIAAIRALAGVRFTCGGDPKAFQNLIA
jgi:hypothetical protein